MRPSTALVSALIARSRVAAIPEHVHERARRGRSGAHPEQVDRGGSHAVVRIRRRRAQRRDDLGGVVFGERREGHEPGRGVTLPHRSTDPRQRRRVADDSDADERRARDIEIARLNGLVQGVEGLIAAKPRERVDHRDTNVPGRVDEQRGDRLGGAPVPLSAQRLDRVVSNPGVRVGQSAKQPVADSVTGLRMTERAHGGRARPRRSVLVRPARARRWRARRRSRRARWRRHRAANHPGRSSRRERGPRIDGDPK